MSDGEKYLSGFSYPPMEPTYPTAPSLPPPESAAPAPPAYPTLKESWGALGWYLLAMLAAVVPLVILMAVQGKKPTNSVGLLVGHVGQAGLIWWLLCRAGSRAEPLRWGSVKVLWPVLLLLVPLTLCVGLSLQPVAWLQLPSWGVEGGLKQAMQQPLLALLAIGVGAPVLEEALFRGILLPGLARNYGPTKAILQTSLLFGIIHFNPSQSLSAFLIGLFLGWLYVRTQSLWACILVHATNNIAAWMMLYRAVPGVNWQESVRDVSAWGFAAIGAGMIGTAAGIWYLRRLTPVAAAVAEPIEPEAALA